MSWVMLRQPAVPPDVPARARHDRRPDDRAHQGRAVEPSMHVGSATGAACGRSSSSYGLAGDIERGRSASRRRGPRRCAGPSSAGTAGVEDVQRLTRRFTYDDAALAGGPGGGPDLVADPQAARERRRRALAGPRHVRRDRAPGAGPLVTLPGEQVDLDPGIVGRRAPGAAARRGRQAAARRAAPRRARPAHRATGPRRWRARHGARQRHFARRRPVRARQAVPAGRGADPRLQLVPRVGGRDPVPRRPRRRRA